MALDDEPREWVNIAIGIPVVGCVLLVIGLVGYGLLWAGCWAIRTFCGC